MSKKFLTLLIIIVLILLVTVVWLFTKLPGSNRPQAGPSPYSAVYLSTGDIYFGKLSWFPKPHLTNVWFIQRNVNDQNQPQLSFVPFKSVFWGPVDEIFLNPREIIFWTRIRSDSQITQAIANPGSLNSPPPGGLPAAN